jgi:hypothetical protein
MAKKTRRKNHPTEILDDNGTLIATPGESGAIGRGGDDRKGLAKADQRAIHRPS